MKRFTAGGGGRAALQGARPARSCSLELSSPRPELRPHLTALSYKAPPARSSHLNGGLSAYEPGMADGNRRLFQMRAGLIRSVMGCALLVSSFTGCALP